MKGFLLILACGFAINAVQCYRRTESAALPQPRVSQTATPGKNRPSHEEISAEEKETVAGIAARLITLPGSLSGDQVHEPERILAEAEELSDAAYLGFARTIAANSGDPYAARDAKLQTVFIRFAERNAVMAFDWLLTETALHAGEWKMTSHQVLAWWAVKDPGGAYRWMQAALHRSGLSDPAVTWLKGARRNLAAALAGTLPDDAAPILLEKQAPVGPFPHLFEKTIAMSLSTPEKRTAFMSALTRASAGGELWSSDYSLVTAVLGSISRNGGTLEEFLTACEVLPGDHEKLGNSIEASFLHFGQEPAFIEWGQHHFKNAGWIWCITANWVKRDMEATTAWLAVQPPGPLRDKAINAMTEPLKQFEPDVALAWAVEVTDPVTRDSLCRSIFEEWVQASPEQATAAFQAKGIKVPVP